MIRQSHIVPDAYQKTAWVLYKHILFSVKKTFLGHLKLVLFHLFYWRRKIWVDLHCWWLAARHNAQRSSLLFSPFVWFEVWFGFSPCWFCCAIRQVKAFVSRLCYFCNARALFPLKCAIAVVNNNLFYTLSGNACRHQFTFCLKVASVWLNGQDLQICEIDQWLHVPFRLKKPG